MPTEKEIEALKALSNMENELSNSISEMGSELSTIGQKIDMVGEKMERLQKENDWLWEQLRKQRPALYRKHKEGTGENPLKVIK